MSEEKQERLRILLEKYPNYKIAFGETYLVINKYGNLHIMYNWKRNIVREYKPINQTLFNEIMEIVDDSMC